MRVGRAANGTAGTNPTINVLANDTDVDAGDTMSVSGVAAGNVGSASGSVGASVAGQYGSIQIASNGIATYTVDNSNPAVEALLNSGDTLTDVFTYTVQDTAGLESTTQVTVTIEGANDAPVASADAGIADESGGVSNAIAGTNATGNVLTNDNAIDSGDTHSVTGVATGVQTSTSGGVDSGVVGTYGTLIVDSAGNYTYVIDDTNTDVEALRTSTDTLSEVFSYTIEDAGGLSSTAQLTITIRGANDAPVATFDTATAVEAGGAGNGTAGTNPTGNVLSNDTDVDANDTMNVDGVVAGVAGSASGNVATDVAGSYGSINIDANGNYTYTVDNSNAAVEALRNSSETLDDVFTYTTTDAAGATSSTKITVTIQGSNDEPVISVQAGDSAAESISETDTTLTSSGTLTVTDLDLTDLVTSTVSNVVAGGTTTGLLSDNSALLAMLTSTVNVLDATEQSDQLTWNFDSAGEAFDYLAAGESLTLTYTLTVTDLAGTTATQEVVITINGTNDAPDVTIGGGSAAESLTETNTTLVTSGTLTVSDLDLSNEVTSTVSSVVAGGTTTGLASNHAALLAMLTSTPNVLDGSELTDFLNWNFNSAGEAFDYLAVGESLTLTYTITVTDSQEATDSQDVVITINGTNDTPEITIETGDSAAETLVKNNATLTTTGTLTTTDLDLSDTVGSTVSSVVASGDTTGLLSTNAALLAMLNSTVSVLDSTETSGTFTWDFDSAGEHFDYLAAGESLLLTYTITVTDSQGTTDTQDVTITVTGANDVPVITVEAGDSSADTLTETDTTLTTSGTLTVTDLNLSDSVTSSVSGVVSSGATTGLASNNAALLSMLSSTANVIDGSETVDQLNWAFHSASESFDYLAVGESLTLTYTITVADSQGATDTQDVVITINGTNDAPDVVIGGGSAAESITETNTTLTSSGTLSVSDLDLSDGVTSTVSSVVEGGTTMGLASNNAALLAMLTSTPNLIDGSEIADTLSWNFNSAGESFDYLAASEALTLTYTITVTDSQGASDSQDVVIIINGTNDTPDITIESGDSAAETLIRNNATLLSSGTLTTTDLDLSDTVASTVSSVVASGDISGLASNNAALQAMLSSTAAVLDASETSDTLTWNFDSGSEHFDYLAAGESLVLTYTITVTDSQGGTDTQDVVITISGANDLPVLTVEAGDSDSETLVETDSVLTTSGTLTVTDLNLSDSVTSTVSGVVSSGTTTGLASNNAALLSMLSSTPNVLDNSETVDQLAWTFNSVSESFDFLAAGESLTLTYTITVTDSQGATDTQDVVITIDGTNDTPEVTILGGDSAAESLSETDTTLMSSGTLTTTDLDLSDLVTSTVSGVVAGGTTAGLQSNDAALLAMLTSTASVLDGTETAGQLNWNFNSAAESFDYLVTGESLTLTYTITITDSQGVTDTQDVVLTINGTNDAPEITGGPATSELTETDAGLSDSGTFTVTDLDRSDVVLASVDDVVVGGTGAASVPATLSTTMLQNFLSVTPGVVLDATQTSATLSWDFDSSGESFDFLNSGETLVLTYTINVTDDAATPLSDSQTVTVTITGTNDGPTAVVDTATAVEASGQLNAIPGVNPSGNVLANDTDLDEGDSKTVAGVVAGVAGSAAGSVGVTVDGQYGSVIIQADGSYVYNVDNDNAAVEALRTAVDTLDDVFTYTMVDADGASSTQQITITIQGGNDAPHDLTATGMNIDENSANGQLVGTITAQDVDSGDTASYQLSDDAGGRFAIDSSGNLRVLDSSRLDYEIDTSHDIGVEVTDAAGATFVKTLTVTLNDVNEFSVVGLDDSDSRPNEVQENSGGGTSVGITAWAVDADATNSTLTHTLVDNAGGRFTVNSATGEILTSGTAPLNYESDASHTIVVRSASADGSEVLQSYTINVLDVNEAPVAVNDSYSTLAGQSLSLRTPDPIDNDVDVDGDELDLVVVAAPANGTLSIDLDGQITYTPTSGYFGMDSFTYRSDDGVLLSDNIATVSISIQAVGGGTGGGSTGGGSGSGGSSGSGSADSNDTDAGDGSSNTDDSSTGSGSGSSNTDGGALTGGLEGDPEAASPQQASEQEANLNRKHAQRASKEDAFGSDDDKPEGDAEIDSMDGGRSLFRNMGSRQDDALTAATVLEKGLADELLELDQDMLMSWYLGANPTNHLSGEDEEYDYFVGSIGTTLGIASIGYVLWALRGGMFVATMYAGIPGWRMLDPASLLSAYRGDERPKDRVEELLDHS